jgi:3-dehydroquinate synthase class II
MSTKQHTKMRAGRLVAVYVDDGQGRRLVLADEGRYSVAERVMVLATTQAEAKQAIAVLYQLAEELPP